MKTQGLAVVDGFGMAVTITANDIDPTKIKFRVSDFVSPDIWGSQVSMTFIHLKKFAKKEDAEYFLAAARMIGTMLPVYAKCFSDQKHNDESEILVQETKKGHEALVMFEGEQEVFRFNVEHFVPDASEHFTRYFHDFTSEVDQNKSRIPS